MFHEILLLISFEYLKIMRLVNIISECKLAMFNTHFVDRPGPSHKLCFENTWYFSSEYFPQAWAFTQVVFWDVEGEISQIPPQMAGETHTEEKNFTNN